MDFADSSLFTPNFAYENDLDLSSLISPSTLISYQESNPCSPIIHCAGIQNEGRQNVCETTKASEIGKGEDEPKNKLVKHKEIERQRIETTMTNEIRKGEDEPKNKKAKHKEIERQRRQEASSLFKNLRYLLPAQYIKGKRSSSDHVKEAVNYIKDLKKKIKEISEKRDRIKRSITHLSSTTRECSIRSLASSTSSPSSTCSCVGDTHIDIVVRPCLIGLEIVVSCCFRQPFLSSVLQLLAQEQCLNVVSCISTRLHQRFIHTIVSEVEEGIEVYFSELHEKIMKLGRSSYEEDTIVSNSKFERSLERL